MPQKLKVFISYAHVDEDIKTELDKHLIGMKRSEKIAVWHDRKILAGEAWAPTIKKELEEAHIILLLISVDFNNSQYIWDKELAIALQRHGQGTARIIPIIARTCDWHDMPYAKLQALPTGAKPITSFPDRDMAYTEIAKGIRAVVEWMLNK